MKEERLYCIKEVIKSKMMDFLANESKYQAWLNRKHPSFRDNMGYELSPQDMIDDGKEEEVLKLIKLYLDR